MKLEEDLRQNCLVADVFHEAVLGGCKETMTEDWIYNHLFLSNRIIERIGYEFVDGLADKQGRRKGK